MLYPQNGGSASTNAVLVLKLGPLCCNRVDIADQVEDILAGTQAKSR